MSENNRNSNNGVGKDVVYGTLGVGAGLGAKALATAAVPTLMSTTGTVVAGVGTIHSGLTATVASFGATALGPLGWIG